jgi:uncharacterized membrane protein YjgN (DUF898 family)
MNETWVSASFAFMALGTFSGYAAYRARRYRLTRTVFRGLRCHQTGSAILYAVRVMLWWILVGMTLGLAWPWAMASLERYKMRNTFYGDLRGSFAGSGTSLFASGILIWLLIMGPLVGLAVAGGMLIDWSALIDALDDPDQFGSTINAMKDDHNARLGFRLLLRGGFWAVLMGTVIYPAYQAIVMRWWLGGLRLGGAAVASDLRIGRFYKAYLLYLAYVMLFSIAFFAAVGLAFGLGYMALSDRYESDAQAEGLVYATLTLAYLVYLLGIHTIYQVVIKLDLWRAAAESMLISGCAAFDHVRANKAASPAFGEGLANALDIGGI